MENVIAVLNVNRFKMQRKKKENHNGYTINTIIHERGIKMPLFERDYKAAAVTELERRLRDIEDRNKAAQTRNEFIRDASNVDSNVDFAQQLNLISDMQAEAYKERVRKSRFEFEHMQRTETRADLVDGFENPRERSARYQGMDSYNAQILRERTKANEERYRSEQVQARIYDDDERNR